MYKKVYYALEYRDNGHRNLYSWRKRSNGGNRRFSTISSLFHMSIPHNLSLLPFFAFFFLHHIYFFFFFLSNMRERRRDMKGDLRVFEFYTNSTISRSIARRLLTTIISFAAQAECVLYIHNSHSHTNKCIHTYKCVNIIHKTHTHTHI